MISIHRSKRPARFPWILALFALAPAFAAEVPEVVLRQATEADGAALPRPTIGIAAPDSNVLPFHLALSFRCPGATERQQLFVSIADTTHLEDVSNSPSPLIVQVDVPMRQLQWLMNPDAECANVSDKRAPDEADAIGLRYFRLPASAAGYAMLTCTGKDNKPSAATTLVPLDVWLSCPAMEAPQSSRSSAPVSETGPGSNSEFFGLNP